jgi:membrane associated rhomboid family serine protease
VAALIPISDANPTRRFPFVTIALIAINIIVFFFVEPGFGTDNRATLYFYENAPVPCQLEDACPNLGFSDAQGVDPVLPDPTLGVFLLSAVFSTFLHAGFMHIIGNMLFLWVFGNNIEDHLGRVKYVAFYLLGGLAASMAHVLWTLRADQLSDSQIGACLSGAVQTGCAGIGQYVPAVGASGAVAAVMGAYIVLYPKAKVNVLVPIFILLTVVQMSALVVLGIWFLYQFLIGAPDISGIGDHSGVAWMAHVGGFVFGALGILLLGGRPHRDPPDTRWEPRSAWPPDDRYDR